MALRREKPQTWTATVAGAAVSALEALRRGPGWGSGQKAHLRACLLWLAIAGVWFCVLRHAGALRAAEAGAAGERRYRPLFSPQQKLVAWPEQVYNLTVGSSLRDGRQTVAQWKKLVYAPAGEGGRVALKVQLPTSAVGARDQVDHGTYFDFRVFSFEHEAEQIIEDHEAAATERVESHQLLNFSVRTPR